MLTLETQSVRYDCLLLVTWLLPALTSLLTSYSDLAAGDGLGPLGSFLALGGEIALCIVAVPWQGETGYASSVAKLSAAG